MSDTLIDPPAPTQMSPKTQVRSLTLDQDNLYFTASVSAIVTMHSISKFPQKSLP